jgi:hypothetical protein
MQRRLAYGSGEAMTSSAPLPSFVGWAGGAIFDMVKNGVNRSRFERQL